jgi:hypothetical protein
MPKGTTIITAKTSNILHKCVIYICLSDIRIYIFGEGKGVWGKEGRVDDDFGVIQDFGVVF